MNEFDVLRKAFPEQEPPSAEAAAGARRQVQDLIRTARSPRRRFMARWRAGWVGTAVTAATALVAVVALGGSLLVGHDKTDEAVPGGPSSTLPPTTPRLTAAAKVLIAMAIRQETNEKVSGKWFRVRSLHLSSTQVGNPKYTLRRRSITESWMPMKPGVKSWFGWVNLGYQPATLDDLASWRAQGSPARWQLPYEKDPISTTDGEPVVNRMSFEDVPPGYYLTGDRPLSAEQIAALPTDPSQLRKVLAGAATDRADVDYTVFAAAGRLLFEMPSPPKLRGAALRVLAALPGARIRTGVKDPLGRTGTEITLRTTLDKPDSRRTVMFGVGTSYIVDPTTGRLLSQTVTGGKTGSTVVLESGWTDDRPTPPSRTVK
ncbi:CU044_5270 family protein [Kribbella sp. NPDC026611]|uniref:CU044_5270 family protein n=1 Tax=Kribbella sp. NPDC026611 TaxID=3154911 RepID=UPI0033C916A6